MKSLMLFNLIKNSLRKSVIFFILIITLISCSNSTSKNADPEATNTTKKTSDEYINTLLPEASRIQKEYGIPLDLTLAIARQESGNGDYIIGKGNHFGLRCASDDCVTLEKAGQQISYETCPDVSECFNIFAKTIKELSGEEPITLNNLYEKGYASSPLWVDKVSTIQQEVQQTLSQAGIKY